MGKGVSFCFNVLKLVESVSMLSVNNYRACALLLVKCFKRLVKAILPETIKFLMSFVVIGSFYKFTGLFSFS